MTRCNGNSSDWTDERVETMRRMLKADASCAEVARALGGVTRNAVIGKIRRLGLTDRPRGNNGAQHGVRQAMPRKAHITLWPPKPTLVETPAPKPKGAEPPAIGPLRDFPASGCRFIHGDVSADWRCCGAPSVSAMRQWCEYHLNRCFQQPAPKRAHSEVGA